ncbi:MAG: hypothetical protein K2M82_05940, partial [Lachnospiraceae bacterium]|nr:hypothetical protein [Lachnospiraceae bacterium]
YRIKKDRCTEAFKKMQFEKGSGYTKQMFSRQRFLSAFAFSMSVMLYILALAPLSIIETYGGAAFTLSCFILCCAIGATYFYKRVKLIFEKSKILSQYNMPAPFLFICKVYRKIGNFICDNLKLSLYIVLNAVVLVTALFAYFILSYDTGAWGVTWIIFVMAIIMNRIIKNFLNLLFLKEADKYEGNLH